jgi:hypothetical protein
LRGIESGLDGDLEGVLAEVGEEAADPFLAGVDHLSGRGLVDGVGDLQAELVKALLELLAEVVGGELRLGIYGRYPAPRGCGGRLARNA